MTLIPWCVSELLLGTVKDSRLLLEQTKAWYAAEGGIERALVAVSDHKPGYEEDGQDQALLSASTKYNYEIHATGQCVPADEYGNCPEQANNEFNEESFAELGLNESVVIPLFDETTGAVEDFTVEYYLPTDISQALQRLIENNPEKLARIGDFDVLRWKLFGTKIAGDQTKFEVINEFSPATQPGANPPIVTQADPACITTTQDPDCWQNAQYFDRQADTTLVKPDYTIKQFLDEHTNNFLILSNYINPEFIAPDDSTLSFENRVKISKIKYRVVAAGDKKLTLPNIHISASALIGATKQSIDLILDRDRFLPVFNFALYRTADANNSPIRDLRPNQNSLRPPAALGF